MKVKLYYLKSSFKCMSNLHKVKPKDILKSYADVESVHEIDELRNLTVVRNMYF